MDNTCDTNMEFQTCYDYSVFTLPGRSTRCTTMSTELGTRSIRRSSVPLIYILSSFFEAGMIMDTNLIYMCTSLAGATTR
jgi:hypothetical protein